jgi:hypothetical protein
MGLGNEGCCSAAATDLSKVKTEEEEPRDDDTEEHDGELEALERAEEACFRGGTDDEAAAAGAAVAAGDKADLCTKCLMLRSSSANVLLCRRDNCSSTEAGLELPLLGVVPVTELTR